MRGLVPESGEEPAVLSSTAASAGCLTGKKSFVFCDQFVTQQIGILTDERVGNIFALTCMVCGQGNLKLLKITPLHHKDPHSSSDEKQHTGNSYEFECVECGAKHSGTYFWGFLGIG